MRFAALALALAAMQPNAFADDSIQALVAYGKRVEEGANAVLAGQDAAKAFAPWTLESSEGLAPAREAGGAAVRFFGMEFEILFRKDGADVYQVRTFVHVSGDRVSFVRMEGRAISGSSYTRFLPLDELAGDAAPLGEAARALVAALRSDAEIPIASSETLAEAMPFAPARKELEKGIEYARRSLPDLRAAVAALEADEYRVRVDDLACVVLDTEGTAIGILRGSLEVEAGGRIGCELGRFRPFSE